MAGPKGETVSAGGMRGRLCPAPGSGGPTPAEMLPRLGAASRERRWHGCLASSGSWTLPLASGVGPGGGPRLGWGELTPPVLSLQGPAGYKGMVGTIGAAGRPVSALPPPRGLRGRRGTPHFAAQPPSFSPPGQGRPPGTTWGPW